MKKTIPVNRPLLEGNELSYVKECIESGWISSEGPFVNKFEKSFSGYHKMKYAVAVSSGTAAIDCAITSLSLSPGDEIIIPTFTIISCINQIVRLGLKPVFVDCDLLTFNMKSNDVLKKITKKTKAIFIVHVYGLPVDMTDIIKIAKKNNIKIIEDCAEILGQKYKNKLCGTFGDVSIFSFYPNKHITCGEGGMILTNSYKIFNKCRELRNICFQKNPQKRFIHNSLGWNYRMTNVQAAIGLAQLENLDKAVERKRFIGIRYNNLLSDILNIQLPEVKTDYAENIFWVFTIVLKNIKKFNSISFAKKLRDQGVESRPLFFPLHKQPALQKNDFITDEKFPNSEYLYKYGLYIPSGIGTSDHEINEVAMKVRKIIHG